MLIVVIVNVCAFVELRRKHHDCIDLFGAWSTTCFVAVHEGSLQPRSVAISVPYFAMVEGNNIQQ